MKETGKFPNVICDGVPAVMGDVHLSPNARIALYGEGCFDTFRSYRGGIVRPDHHLDRLHRGMRYLGLGIPDGLRDRSMFLNLLKRLLEVNDGFDDEVRIRIQIWADDHTAGYCPGNRTARYIITGSVITSAAIHLTDSDRSGIYDDSDNPDRTDTPVRPGTFSDTGNHIMSEKPDDSDRSVELITSRYRRISSVSLPSDVKWTNGINYILAAREAAEKNADDALMLTSDGYLSESTIANIFWRYDNTVYTPSEDCDLLPGITRALTMDVLNEFDFPVQTGKFQPEELMKADTVWLCNSIREWYPVSRIDDHHFTTDKSFWSTLGGFLQQRKHQEMHYVR